MEQELRKIKKLYGESMARFCRDNFSTILEKEGQLLELLTSKFEPNHDLYTDILAEEMENSFKEYIYSLVNVQLKDEIEIEKSPEELLSEAGYDLYECITEEEIQAFKKYYAPGEELCTFHGKRLESCRVYFAVKKDVDKINREDFKNPMRQDIYGTSVISIQFSKNGANTLSIKNRYNHTVKNPDATFGNNLDNIVPGLTKSFEMYYGIVQKNPNTGIEIPGYTVANDGKQYKYNYEIDNIYYCPNNIIIDNSQVKRFEKEKYVVLDNFVLDLVSKQIYAYDKKHLNGFVDTITNIEKIVITKESEEKEIKIIPKEGEAITIVLDNQNCIIKYKNSNVKEIKDWFLGNNVTLKELELPNVEKIERLFLHMNSCLEKLELPKVKEIGHSFLEHNNSLTEINLSYLEKVSRWFLCDNKVLKELYAPELKQIADDFLSFGGILTTLELPKVKRVGSQFLSFNRCLCTLKMPELEEVGSCFLSENQFLQTLEVPKLISIEHNFLRCNIMLKELYLPNIRSIGDCFLTSNKVLDVLDAPLLTEIGECFMVNNEKIKEKFKDLNEAKKEGYLDFEDIIGIKFNGITDQPLVSSGLLQTTEEFEMPKLIK